MIATSFFTVGYFSGLFAYWSCLPERPELPPPDDPKTGLYSQSTIVGFTRPQYYEWDHQTNSMMGQFPMWPNSKWFFNVFFVTNSQVYREFVARKRFWALISDFPNGWKQLGSQVKQWFEEVSVPEYGLPPIEDNRITVSFELSCLIDAQYNVDVGWQFRYEFRYFYILLIRLGFVLEPRIFYDNCQLLTVSLSYTQIAHITTYKGSLIFWL